MSLTAFLPTGAPQVLPFIGTPGAATVGHALVWSESPQGFTLSPIAIGPDQFSGVLPVASGGTGSNNGSITGTGALTFAAGGTNQGITLQPSGTGQIGIGTVSPLMPIDIRGNTRIAGALGLVGSSPYPLSIQSNSSQTWLEILNNGGVGRGVFFGIVANDFHLWNYQGGNTVFYNGPTPGSALERFRITGSGNIGIGTNNPSVRLHVGDSTESTSTTTGAVCIDGGLGVAKNLNIGGNLRFAGGTVPATVTSAGTTGDIRYDGSHLYICTATDTWRRTALSTW